MKFVTRNFHTIRQNLSVRFVLKFFLVKFFVFIVVHDTVSHFKFFNSANEILIERLQLRKVVTNEKYFSVYKFTNLTTRNDPETKRFVKDTNAYVIKHILVSVSFDLIHHQIARVLLNSFLGVQFKVDHNLTSLMHDLEAERVPLLTHGKALANLMTFSGLFMCFFTIQLLANDKNPRDRQLACLLFQIKNVLDSLDGPVARLDIFSSKHGIDSLGKYDFGRVIDAWGSTFSMIFFLIGSYIFILKDLGLIEINISETALNVVYAKYYRLMSFISVKFNIKNSIKYSGEYSDKLVEEGFDYAKSSSQVNLLKLVYLNFTIFTSYLIISGSGWNAIFNNYRDVFANQEVIIEFFLYFL